MCRSIKVLRQPNLAVTREDVHAAALQFIRKISGYRSPSLGNQPAFDTAVIEVTEASLKLLNALGPARSSRNQARQSERAIRLPHAPGGPKGSS